MIEKGLPIKNRNKTILECEQTIKETELRKQSLLSTT